MRDEEKSKKQLLNEMKELRRLHAEREVLQKSGEPFRSLVQSASDAIYSIDADNNLISWNNAAETIFGYTADEIIGSSFAQLVPERVREKHLEALNQMFLAKQSYFIGKVAEYPRLRKDGTEFPAEISYGRWETAEGVFFTAIVRDISERTRSEEALKKTAQNLEQTIEELKKANQKIVAQQRSVIEEERLKVVLQMAGATAHELNQPLTALLCNIELVNMKGILPKEAAYYIDKIEKAGQSMDSIIKKIQRIRQYDTRSYCGGASIINFDQKVRILSVEDSDGDFETIRTSLSEQEQISLTRAGNLAEAMQLLEQDQFELILLDHMLPDGNGLDFLRSLEGKGVELPVVVITGQGNEAVASQLIQAGAYDYLSKDMVSNVSLPRSIANTMEKALLKREVREAKKKMAESKTTDDLTEVYTRKYFMEVLEREVARSQRYGTELVLCMIDLDHFKQINDTHGNPAGDMVLSEVGKMLKKCMRQSDLVSRYGDEEFAVILSHTQAESSWTVCERFRDMVAARKFKHDSSSFSMTVSIGFSSFDHSNSETSLDLIERVGKALSQAKKAGRNRVIEYNR